MRKCRQEVGAVFSREGVGVKLAALGSLAGFSRINFLLLVLDDVYCFVGDGFSLDGVGVKFATLGIFLQAFRE